MRTCAVFVAHARAKSDGLSIPRKNGGTLVAVMMKVPTFHIRGAFFTLHRPVVGIGSTFQRALHDFAGRLPVKTKLESSVLNSVRRKGRITWVQRGWNHEYVGLREGMEIHQATPTERSLSCHISRQNVAEKAGGLVLLRTHAIKHVPVTLYIECAKV